MEFYKAIEFTCFTKTSHRCKRCEATSHRWLRPSLASVSTFNFFHQQPILNYNEVFWTRSCEAIAFLEVAFLRPLSSYSALLSIAFVTYNNSSIAQQNCRALLRVVAYYYLALLFIAKQRPSWGWGERSEPPARGLTLCRWRRARISKIIWHCCAVCTGPCFALGLALYSATLCA